ncbi:MAG: peptide chain release factor N(5)-glutamine methyltransferase [Phycisphaeraceae bacterium]|nr:MAG: peptide chain release factor N(5)-glutamine methyltransferase [Phycisphaeraceae bacterium]
MTTPMQPSSEQTWTTRNLIRWMRDTFARKGLDSPDQFADMLMMHVLGCERVKLYLDHDRPASAEERARLRDLVIRAMNHEPVQYLVGMVMFFGLPIDVDKRVLIPRPSTETIVEEVLQHARATHGISIPPLATHADYLSAARIRSSASSIPLLIADVCTGSGCIAIALAKRLPGARVVATDISADALDVAKANAEKHGVADRVDFAQGDLLTPVLAHPVAGAKGSLNYLVSNPPYIPDHEWETVEPNVKNHEPHGALRGGADGMDFVKRVLAEGPALLAPGGQILVEIAACTAPDVLTMAKAHPLLADARIIHDHEGLARVIVARRADQA